MSNIGDLFVYLCREGGSDLHLSAGLSPRVRLHGELFDVPGWPALADATLRGMLRGLVSEAQWARFGAKHDLDFAYGAEGLARFRGNYLEHENGVGAVFRVIPDRIASLDDLGAAPGVRSLVNLEQGLVLVTGPTGSGKSTTLAAVLDGINAGFAKHIVTIEDPIEFVHASRKSTLSQREVGTDTPSFAVALRSAIRQDASVILVGELRDPETIQLAITAAEMGALVFGTLHTNGAAQTIDRVVDAFPSEQQPQVRSMLAESLAAVVSQLLLRTADGKGRVAAVEVLLRTSGLANVVREGNTPLVQSILQGGRAAGMQSMDDALWDLVRAGRVAPIDAQRKATHKKRFDELIARGAT